MSVRTLISDIGAWQGSHFCLTVTGKSDNGSLLRVEPTGKERGASKVALPGQISVVAFPGSS